MGGGSRSTEKKESPFHEKEGSRQAMQSKSSRGGWEGEGVELMARVSLAFGVKRS